MASTSAHSDDLLHGPRLTELSQPDRDLVTALVLGVLRWQIALDARLRPLLSRPDLQLALPVAIALRLGAFQLLYLTRIPPHAALNESVELVRAAGHGHAAGLVNAVLRKLAGAPDTRKPIVEGLPAMAERLGHPVWLAERWAKQYGRAAVEAICRFDQQQPTCPPVFAEPNSAEANSGAAIQAFPSMDAGSRLVAEIASAAGKGAERVWDCCAAPGGKTIVVGRRLPEARLLATDHNPSRLRRLEQRLARELPGDNVSVEAVDATALPVARGSFDLILCDVPCSGTGTLARNPEIRHRLEPDDLPRQAARQRRILAAALGRLAPGGTLVYSTCSLEEEECEGVVHSTLQAGIAPVQRLDIDPVLEELQSRGLLQLDAASIAGWSRNGNLRTLPGANFEGDGFFAALFRRA